MNKNKSVELIISNDSLEKDHHLLHLALDSSVAGIIITDARLDDNPIIYCNNAFVQMSGFERNEVIGRNCRFLQRDDRDQEARSILKSAIEKGESCQVEIRNYTKAGTLFWNELYVSPIKDNNGTVTHFIGVQNDVSRRKKVEEELREHQERMEDTIKERTKALKESEEYLSSIIQTVRESLVVLDNDMKVLSVNDQFTRTFKVSKEETEGVELFQLGNGQWDIESLKILLHDVLPTNNPVLDFEVEHDFPHIGAKTMLLNAHRVELEGQYKDRILLAIEDITDRREIERRKDDFLSIASHELKTPLTTVKGFIQLLKRQVPENTTDKFNLLLNKTDEHLNRLTDLVNDLLNMSRIQSGNIELHKEYFDFDKAVADAVEAIQASCNSHNLILTGEATDNLLGDESNLMQLLVNLISNGIKYSPDADKILINLSRVSDFVKVAITDFGMGIASENQEKIFERFYRVDDVQKHFPGMGVGLYVCQQIVINHGGSIWVDSEKGKGSTFSFTLPLRGSDGK